MWGRTQVNMAFFLREIGYKGYIVSFEPVRSVYDELQGKCAKDDKWFCYNFALGNKQEEKMLNVYQSTDFSSFLKANTYSKKTWKGLSHVTPEKVKVFKLDDKYNEIIKVLGCTNHMLKMDTQGYDKFVFDGAINCLQDISVIQSELSLISVYEKMLGAYDILKEFHENKFYISGMYPINRDESLAVIEYDCVLVRKLF